MKKLLILPGNSPRNRAWGEDCAEFFADQFSEIHLQLYDHWDDGEEVINVPAELDKIIATVEGSDSDAEWYVCAKSVGSLVALIAVHEDIIQPERCIFFGMPLDTASEELFKDNWSPLAEFVIPTLVFHNISDPVTDCSFTEAKLKELGQNITFKPVVDDTHDYQDFADYQFTIEEFLS